MKCEVLARRYAAVGVFEGDAEAVRGFGSLEQRLVEIDGRLGGTEFVVKRVPGFLDGSGVNHIQGLAGMVGKLLKGPAFYYASAVGEDDVIEVGIERDAFFG